MADTKRYSAFVPSFCSVLFIAVLALAVLRYFITAAMPLTAHAHGLFDDALFIQQAENFVNGLWLGGYQQLTLVKAPFYSLFIGTNYALGLQFKSIEHLIYIIACVLFYLAMVNSSKQRILSFLMYCLLLFSPFFHTSVERGWLYSGLTLLFVSLVFYLLSRANAKKGVSLPGVFVLGFVLSLIYLSREEMIWLMPMFGIVIGLFLWRGLGKKKWRHAAAMLLLFGLGFQLLVVAVSSANYYQYGFYGITDTSDRAFRNTIKRLKKVKVGDDAPYVDVTQQALAAMYPVVPSLNELKPYLSGDVGKRWGSYFCRRRAETCDEIGGGYFFWAFRESLQLAGKFSNYQTYHDYLSLLSAEIKGACDRGELDCSKKAWPARYPIRWQNWTDYVVKMPDFVGYVMSGLNNYKPGYGSPLGSQERQQAFELMSNSTLFSRHKKIQLSGWLMSDAADKYIAILPTAGKAAYPSQFRLSASPGLASHFPDNANAALSRFSLAGRCDNADCELLIVSGEQQVKLDVSTLKQGASQKIAGMTLHIERLSRIPDQFVLPALTEWKRLLFRDIAEVYGYFFPALPILSLMIFIALWVLFFKGLYQHLFLLYALMCFVAIGARIAVLILFDDFTQQAVIGQIRHFLPVMPLLLVFFAVNLLMLVDFIGKWRRREKEMAISEETKTEQPVILSDQLVDTRQVEEI